MQIGAFLTEIENVFSISEKVNDAAKEASEKGLKQSWLSRSSAIILEFHL